MSEAGEGGRNAVRGGAVTLLGQLCRFVIQLVSVVVLARLLSPHDFGLVAMVTAITGAAYVIGDAGLTLAALQARELSAAQRSNLFWLNTAIGTALGLVVFSLAVPISVLYREPQLVQITHVIAVMFPLTGLSAQFRVQVTRELRFAAVVIVEVAAQAISLTAAIAAALAGFGYWALVILQVAMALGVLVGLVIAARWMPSLPRRGINTRPFVRFGVNTMSVALLGYASTSVPTIVLGAATTPTTVGYYNRADTLFTMPMNQLAAPITRVVIPVLARIPSVSEQSRFLVGAQSAICYSLVGIFIMLWTIADPFIPVVLGDDWLPAVPILRILALGGVFQALAYVYYWVFVNGARTGTQLAILAPARLAMIAFALVGVRWGAEGVAWGVTAGLILIWLLSGTVGMRVIGVAPLPLLLASVRPLLLYGLVAVIVSAADLLWFDGWADPVRLVGKAGLALTVGAMGMLVPAWRRDVVGIIRFAAQQLRARRAEPAV